MQPACLGGRVPATACAERKTELEQALSRETMELEIA